MASSLPLGLLLFFLRFADAAQNFQEVSVCPRNADTWKIESDKKNCQGDTPDYLCAAIENNVGRFGEICTKYGLSPEKKCAVLNNQTHNLDSVDCKAASGCPENPYNPSELWKYPICYGNFYGTTRAPPTTSTVQTTAPPVSGPKEGGGSGAGAGTAVGIVLALLILVAVVVLVVFYRRNMFGVRKTMEPWVESFRNLLPGNRQASSKTDEETGVADETVNPLLPGEKELYSTVNKDKSKKKDTGNNTNGKTADDSNEWNEEEMKMKIRKLNILQKYLVHILKKEIDLKDLKEKSINHSKSLGEHFTEPVLQDLYKAEKTDDYSKLDMSLVFALLRNFCVNIKPPTRGWDYDPPAEERTVGADIERIRTMWNKYCDNDYDFKNLDDVFNRMKNKYGTEAVQNVRELSNNTQDEMEDISEMKVKIQSIKLHKDCYVEKGIVITEGILCALKSLETGNVVICKGAIGCGKTHALKAIRNKYEMKGWKVRWIEENLIPLEENLEDKTLVICDNLFGSYGCATFSSSSISSFENALESVREKSRDIHIAVGIHQHVFDEVKRNRNLKILQNKNITVDLDKLTKSEMLLIFKEQQKEGHCKTDSDCWFKTVDPTLVIGKLGETQGHIGSPFLGLMYCHLHELFLDKDFIKNPLQSLIRRFQKMRSDSADYYSLIYLMCGRKYKYGDELPTWAGAIYAFLSKDSLQNTAVQMPAFIRVENSVETLRHEVLTIALFKAASDVEGVFLPVVQNCEIDILLQLMRPEESCYTEFSCGFVNPKKNSQARNIGKHLVKRFADRFTVYWDGVEHPLKSNGLFKEKYGHYIKSTPKEKKVKALNKD